MRIIFFLFLHMTLQCASQEVINIDGINCGVHGSSSSGSKTYFLNEYKNRFAIPSAADFDSTISIIDLMKSSDQQEFSMSKAVTLNGYVFNVKTGGVETCNCKTKDHAFRDTHIELTPDENHTDAKYRVIVEVTPRLREIMAEQGLNWSTEYLHGMIKGVKIQVSGWLFYDAEHEDASFSNDPDDNIGRQNWRATCWEIHPVTSITILPAGTLLHNGPDSQKIIKVNRINSGSVKTPQDTLANNKISRQSHLPLEDNNTFIYILSGLTILAIIIIILLIINWNKRL